MPLESEKTRQHLRDQWVMQGKEERLRAIQALSYGYGTGSKAALATLLKAALGGVNGSGEESGVEITANLPTLMGQVAEPMQHGANDPVFDSLEASQAS